MKRIFIMTMVLMILLAMPVIADAAAEAYIPDENMEAALKEILGKDDSEPLTPSELGALTGTIDLSEKGIKKITGIQYLTGATAIDLSSNDIEKYSDKMYLLENLKMLDMSFNRSGYTFPTDVTDIPNLETLNLAANKFSRVPDSLSKMKMLKNLDLSANQLDEVPAVLKDMTFENLNLDYNFFELKGDSADKKALDALNVTGELLACRQLVEIPGITYSTQNNKIKIKWNEMPDVPFYDGTYGVISGYTVKVNGEVLATVDADTYFYNITGVADRKYRVAISPNYAIEGYGDFYVSKFSEANGFVVGYDGFDLPEDPKPVMYANAYPTPTPEPTETPTPEPTETPTTKPAPKETAPPSATTDNENAGGNKMSGLIWMAGGLFLIIMSAVVLIVILKKKNN